MAMTRARPGQFVGLWHATWTGVDFTFNGGVANVLQITGDDSDFDDACVGTGPP